MSNNRRNFIKTAAIAGSGALIYGCRDRTGQSPAVHTGQTLEWKMVTAWPPKFPMLGESADKLAQAVKELSGGRFTIKVYGAGELVPAFESFDAVSQGIAELGHSAPYYWAGKIPSASFFSAVPFGMNTTQTNAWLMYGGGLELMKEVYGGFNLIPFLTANTGGQTGGWFNRKIEAPGDLKGLKMRIPGLGGRIITKAGATTVLSPGAELYTNLERGVIDALEWVGPYHDYLMGFHKIAKYYYYPGWQEPTGVIELIVNKQAYEQLPAEYQAIIRYASQSLLSDSISEMFIKNQEYFIKLRDEEKITILPFPEEVLSFLKEKTAEVIAEITSSDPVSKKVYESYIQYQRKFAEWYSVGERNYI
ncbi:MAG: ABC transporter substrate-binding protein [Ignavibacteriales bacterium]